jgi:hypothetical protein
MKRPGLRAYGVFSYGDQDDLLIKAWTDEVNARLNGGQPPP